MPLVSDKVQQAHERLTRIETSVAKVGLHIIATNIKVMSFNSSEDVKLKIWDDINLHK